jgi:hypothetical protein
MLFSPSILHTKASRNNENQTLRQLMMPDQIKEGLMEPVSPSCKFMSSIKVN